MKAAYLLPGSHQQSELRQCTVCLQCRFPDCALTEVTLDLPLGMVSWASRWGMASSRIKVFRLEAYAALDACSIRNGMGAPSQPARVIYVPALL